MESQNDFMILRQVVNKAVKQYTDLRKRINWEDKGLSESIMRLAKPFQTGYFTIAFVGNTSAGKSTFINSLIGENLLPTGPHQTTSAITWIVSSDKRYMEVTFANGKKKIFKENLAVELQSLVALPNDFEDLPVNHINNLIKAGKNIDEILELKADIEEETHRSASNKLWEDYVASMPTSKIPDKVVIYLHLPKEYEGWRIIDTPGVGAIGGIQDATKKLLTSRNNDSNTYAVDAVIFLHSCQESIDNEPACIFAEEIRKTMGNLAAGRMFFVLTHASDSSFIQHKDSTLKKAESNFGTKLDIPRHRINYVDSLIHRFITSAKKSKKDFSSPTAFKTPLEDWNEDDWTIVKKIVTPFYTDFLIEGKECTNSALFAELEKISRFEELRNMLNDFLNDAKEKAFSDLLNMINTELDSYGESLRNDIHSVSNGKAAIDRKIQEVQKEKTQLNIALGKVRDEATPGVVDDTFQFIYDDLKDLYKFQSIGEVRNAYFRIIDQGLSTEQAFFDSLKERFASFSGEFQNSTSIFASLDFGQIEYEAERDSYVEDKDNWTYDYNHKIKDGGWSSDPEYAKIYGKKVDPAKKLRAFIVTVEKKGVEQCNEFKKKLKIKIENFFKIASDNITKKEAAATKRFEGYIRNLSDNKAILSELRSKLSCVEAAITELKKFEEES